jgi:hypothetical protein
VPCDRRIRVAELKLYIELVAIQFLIVTDLRTSNEPPAIADAVRGNRHPPCFNTGRDKNAFY